MDKPNDPSYLAFLLKGIHEGTLTSEQLNDVNNIMRKYNTSLETSGTAKWFIPGSAYSIENCPKHKLFFEAGKNYYARLFMASNRSGKSCAGAFEVACHATGDYPSWWAGKVFDKPVQIWAGGVTAQTTRDTVQKELIGPLGNPGLGMIPPDRIISTSPRAGTPNAIDTVQVRHKSGGVSVIGFKSYNQDMEAFMGTAMDVIWLDEEAPLNIYNECDLRTMTTDGIIFVTFTPLQGLTHLVVNFCKSAEFLGGAERFIQSEKEDEVTDRNNSNRAVIQAGWDDAPWLTEEAKIRMLANTPMHLRDARSKGKPGLGAGNVYPVPIEDIKIAPFEIPKYYKRLYALDVGWNRTAALLAAVDPDTDTIYITHEHYMGDVRPEIHAAAIKTWGEFTTGVIDPASRGRSATDGQRLLTIYKAMGLRIRKANNEVESGLAHTYDRLSCGKIKIFSNLHNFFNEYVLYRRDINGRIVKEDDHLMDCLRYIVNNISFALPPPNRTAGGHKYGDIAYTI